MRAVIGLGSNKGRPERRLLDAATALEHVPGITPIGLSSGYWTEPIGPVQPRFLNAAMLVESDLSPGELLAALLGVEAGLGRRRSAPLGPRVIDLDLLLAGDHVVETERLVVPHPRLCERAFALVPLLELEPEAIDPATRRPLREILADLGAQGVGDPFPLPFHVDRRDIGHTADHGFSVTGHTLGEALEGAAMALIDLMVDRTRVVERERRVVEAQGGDDVELMVELLGELVFLLDARQFVPRRVTTIARTDEGTRLAVHGEQLRSRGQLRSRVKAVTYHNAAVERDARRRLWSIRVVVDV